MSSSSSSSRYNLRRRNRTTNTTNTDDNNVAAPPPAPPEFPIATETMSSSSSSSSLTAADTAMVRAAVVTSVVWMTLVGFGYATAPCERLEGPERTSAVWAGAVLTVGLVVRLRRHVPRPRWWWTRTSTLWTPPVVGLASHETLHEEDDEDDREEDENEDQNRYDDHHDTRRRYDTLDGSSGTHSSRRRRRRGNGCWSGVLIGGVTTQIIACLTNAALAFGKVPVLIDPVLHQRVSLVRWAEFTALAFLMTYLTEALDNPTTPNPKDDTTEDASSSRRSNKGWMSPSMTPLTHALCQGLSTFLGMLFPYCTYTTTFTNNASKNTTSTMHILWYCCLATSCALYSTLWPRLRHKARALAARPPGQTWKDAVAYDRARLSHRMLHACAICWTLFPILFFLQGFVLPYVLGPRTTTSVSFWRHSAGPMVVDAVLDVVSKLVQLQIILDVHDGVFDDADGVRAVQRLTEVRTAIGSKWWTASDGVVVAVRHEFSGTVFFLTSPSLSKSSAANTKTKTKPSSINTTTSLIYTLDWTQVVVPSSSSANHHNSNNSDRRRRSPLPDDYAVRPSHWMGDATLGRARLTALAGLVVRAWQPPAEPQPSGYAMVHTIEGVPCPVTVTPLDDHLLVLVVQGLDGSTNQNKDDDDNEDNDDENDKRS